MRELTMNEVDEVSGGGIRDILESIYIQKGEGTFTPLPMEKNPGTAIVKPAAQAADALSNGHQCFPEGAPPSMTVQQAVDAGVWQC